MSGDESPEENSGASIASTNGHPPPQKPRASGASSRQNAAQFLLEPPGWKRGVRTAVRRFCYFAAGVVAFSLLVAIDILPSGINTLITFVLSIAVYLLAIPIGLLLRMDNMMTWGTPFGELGKLVVGLLIVLVNFVCIGALRGFLAGSETSTVGPHDEEKPGTT